MSLSGRILSRHVINSPRDPSIPLCPGEPATHTLLGETQYASTDFLNNGGYILTDSVTNFLKGIGILLVGFQAARRLFTFGMHVYRNKMTFYYLCLIL